MSKGIAFLVGLVATSSVVDAGKTEISRDPTVFRINKEDAHAEFTIHAPPQPNIGFLSSRLPARMPPAEFGTPSTFVEMSQRVGYITSVALVDSHRHGATLK